MTRRARVGLLVAANTFRNPGLTAKLATTVDHVSDGRAILGMGGGWFADEHRAFGLEAEFGSGFGERLDRLAEAVPLIRRLLDGERVTHEGRFYRLHDALAAPRPVQARIPLLIGGSGPTKTLPLVARHADLWNAYGSPRSVAASDAILREHCGPSAGTPTRSSARSISTSSSGQTRPRPNGPGRATSRPTTRARAKAACSSAARSKRSRTHWPDTPRSGSGTRS